MDSVGIIKTAGLIRETRLWNLIKRVKSPGTMSKRTDCSFGGVLNARGVYEPGRRALAGQVSSV